jgi:hypothetical protein
MTVADPTLAGPRIQQPQLPYEGGVEIGVYG